MEHHSIVQSSHNNNSQSQLLRNRAGIDQKSNMTLHQLGIKFVCCKILEESQYPISKILKKTEIIRAVFWYLRGSQNTIICYIFHT